jgi:hypothetical protein
VTSHTPCESDPDQWYIDRDGRRYDDEVLVTLDELRATVGEMPDLDSAQEALDALVEGKVKARLVDRRHARDLCFTSCPVRTICLDKAIGDPDNREQYGIWGGYFPEQRRALERAQDARLARIAKRKEGGRS